MSGCTNPTNAREGYLYPPQAYIQPCMKTPFAGKTYGEALEHLIVVTAEREQCASQIEHINQWIIQTKQGK